MCAACGQTTHVPDAPRRFAALRNPDCRPYLIGAALAMMADNIEHVITYWVLWERFHSVALSGFQVISHWVPFLFLSVWFGGLADRFDCRRVIQAAQTLFMLVSAAWGVLFLTGTLQVWHACVLLVLHGVAGALWGPAEQLMLHDFVGDGELPSAVRLNATFKSLGVLFGPAIGSALLIGLGATWGIFANILFYLPLTLFLFRTRFTGHTSDPAPSAGDATDATDAAGAAGAAGAAPARKRVGIMDSLRVFRDVRGDHTLVSLIILGGLGSFFVGASIQSAMPQFAQDLGAGSAGTAYGILLFANGAGGVIGGIVLEATGWLRPSVRGAVLSTALYGLFSLLFAVSGNYPLAVVLLIAGGVANLVSMSVGQTMVQLLAAPADRGRVIGLYNMSANGLRFGSGVTVGLFGAVVGIHWSLGLSSAALCVGTGLAAFSALTSRTSPAT
ncbi:MFS transporter [Actinoplanes sp. NPDC051851]|uniref:MFS transporter n=1 Tax=Actinoplanes sp. NPDC051851 TaxID=3154753 RepID=UPI00341C6012